MSWKVFNKLLKLSVLFVFSFPMYALEVDIEKACTIALENSRKIQLQEILLTASKRISEHSWNSISPSLSLNETNTFPVLNKSYDANVMFEAKAEIQFSSNLFFNIQKTEKDYEAALITYDELVRTVMKNVRTAYFGLLYEKENLEFQEANLETVKNQYEQNVRKFQAGSISRVDVLSSQVAYEKMKPQFDAAKASYKNAESQFMSILGIDLDKDEQLLLSGSLKELVEEYDAVLSDKDMEQKVWNVYDSGKIPSVLLAKKNLESAKADLNKNRMSVYGPSVSAAYSFQNSRTYLNNQSDGGKNSVFTVGIAIPLDGWLPWSEKADMVKTSKDNIHSQEINIQEEIQNAKRNIASALRNCIQKKNSLSSLELAVQLSVETYSMAKDAYNRGIKDLLSLQNASDQILASKVSLSEGMLAYLNQCTELEALLGLSFGSLYSNLIY